MDGCITEGRYLEPPRTKEMYMSLKPYDNDTIDVLNDILDEHQVYIVTARSEPWADRWIREWLVVNGVRTRGVPILTNPVVSMKNPENAIWKGELVNLLGCELVIDDSPYVYKECDPWVSTYLMDNPYWLENHQVVTSNRIKSWADLALIIGANVSKNNTKSHA